MGDGTGINWTNATWNPVLGCSRISEGCRNCYAERQAGSGRLLQFEAYQGLTRPTDKGPKWTGEVRLIPERLDQPLRWSKHRMIFVNSMSDLFHESVPFETIAVIFAVMASAPRHTFQVLTKRAHRMVEFFAWLDGQVEGAVERYLNGEVMREARAARQAVGMSEPPPPTPTLRGLYDLAAPAYEEHSAALEKPLSNLAQRHWQSWPLPNVWLGVSVEDQAAADERIPLLLQTPARVRWISAEPLLGPVTLNYLHYNGEVEIDALNGTHGIIRPHGGENARLDWVVVGGESGQGARPMHPDWARSLRDQRVGAGVAYFFKQWGEWAPLDMAPDGVTYRVTAMTPDGRTFNPFNAGVQGTPLARIGKQHAGRLLDGVLWDQYPA